MDATCGMCDQPAIVTIPLHLDDDATHTFHACSAHVIETFMTIAATVERFADNPFDRTIAALERKMHDGTGSDNDLTELARYRRLKADAVTRHPSCTNAPPST
jgi:hypothetical protein